MLAALRAFHGENPVLQIYRRLVLLVRWVHRHKSRFLPDPYPVHRMVRSPGPNHNVIAVIPVDPPSVMADRPAPSLTQFPCISFGGKRAVLVRRRRQYIVPVPRWKRTFSHQRQERNRRGHERCATPAHTAWLRRRGLRRRLPI